MRNTLFLLFTFLSIYSYSQQLVLYNEAKTETYLVKDEPGTNKTPLRQIMKVLSEGNSKPLNMTKFYFSYKQKTRILRKNSELEFIVDLQDVDFKGDTKYKGFPMDEYLFPNEADIKLNWVSRTGQIIKSFEYKGVALDPDNKILLDVFVTDTINDNSYKLIVTEKNFYYTTVNSKLVIAKADLVEEYYQTDKQLKLAYNELLTIKPENLDLLFEYKSTIEKNDLLIATILKKDLHNQLDLDNYDPLFIDEKFSDVYNLNNELKFNVMYTIEHLYEIYYNKGLELMSFGKMDAALLNFNKSINNNLLFAPAHFQIAKINYIKKNYDESVAGLENILTQLNPDPVTKDASVELAKNIYNDYLLMAKSNLGQGKYDMVIENISLAKKLCMKIPPVICTSEAETINNDALNGKFNIYTNNAVASIQNEKYTEAEEIIQTARIFYQSNSSSLDVTPLNNTIQKLYNAYINKGSGFNSKADYNSAVTYFEKAQQICKTNETITCGDDLNTGISKAYNGVYNSKLDLARKNLNAGNLSDAEENLNDASGYQQAHSLNVSASYNQLMSDLKYKNYKALISEAGTLISNSKFEEALLKLDDAKSLFEMFGFKEDPAYKTNRVKAAKSLISQHVANGEAGVLSNDLHSARNYYSSAKKVQQDNALDADKDVNSQLSKLKEKIFSQECKNAQAEFDKQYETVLSYIDKKDFMNAELNFDILFKIAADNVDCDIDTKIAKNKRSDVLPGITYQKLIKNIEELIRNGQYEKVYTQYKELGAYFYELNVEKQGLQHTPLFDFVLKCNNDFVIYSVKYYTDLKDYANALTLLKELKKRNYPLKWSSSQQQLLGTALAISDHAKNPSTVAKQAVLNYTAGDKWYNELKKAYLKQWKNF